MIICFLIHLDLGCLCTHILFPGDPHWHSPPAHIHSLTLFSSPSVHLSHFAPQTWLHLPIMWFHIPSVSPCSMYQPVPHPPPPPVPLAHLPLSIWFHLSLTSLYPILKHLILLYTRNLSSTPSVVILRARPKMSTLFLASKMLLYLLTSISVLFLLQIAASAVPFAF